MRLDYYKEISYVVLATCRTTGLASTNTKQVLHTLASHTTLKCTMDLYVLLLMNYAALSPESGLGL